jgi:hypothetical protein
MIFLLAFLATRPSAYGDGNDPLKLYPENYKVLFEN